MRYTTVHTSIITTSGAMEEVLLGDIIRREDHLHKEAQQQLRQNWGTENECTHGQGYHKQPVYSCYTCAERTGKKVHRQPGITP